MPIPLALAIPLLAAGAGFATTAIQARSSRKQSERNIQFQQEQNMLDRAFTQRQYNQQRQDALADFNMQNEYNHPLQQMERLRQAGLNPNLVYGKGADTAAASIRSSQPTKFEQKAPQSTFDPSTLRPGDAMSAFIDTKMKMAQTDNLHEQNELIKKEQLLKMAQTYKTFTEDAGLRFKNTQAIRLADLVAKNIELDATKKEAEIAMSLSENQRRELANTQNVQLTMQKIVSEKLSQAKTAQEIQNLRQTLVNLKQTNTVKRVEELLAKNDVNPKDPWYARIFIDYLNKMSEKPQPNRINPLTNTPRDPRVYRTPDLRKGW